MAHGAVLKEHDMLGMIEVNFLVKIRKGRENNGIRDIFGPGDGRGRDQGQHEDPPD
jgi:hypothetical protein